MEVSIFEQIASCLTEKLICDLLGRDVSAGSILGDLDEATPFSSTERSQLSTGTHILCVHDVSKLDGRDPSRRTRFTRTASKSKRYLYLQ